MPINKVQRPLISAHRCGFEGRYIPNSLEAVRGLSDISVDLIEFDVRVTKDDAFVTLHDDAVMIDTVPTPVECLDAVTVLQHAEGACTLQEMLDAIKGKAIAHVDLKDTRLEVEIADICQATLGDNGYIITTLEDSSVVKLRAARPDIQVALSLGRDVSSFGFIQALNIRLSELFPSRRVRRCDPTMLALNYRIADRGVARWAYKHDLPVLLWTMNTGELIDEAWENPYICAFTTNNPRLAISRRPEAVMRMSAKRRSSH